ncbi:MAG: response regulator transcription factor [Acidobacteriaceae bacterium]|nr:response regulator transcription factor [Acidobacteriaceae bacterium]MBV9223314.1 response regulator transcription factor [Acidobacteriaceae bacterium]
MDRLIALIADDHPEWRAIITRILSPIYEVIGFAERGDQILELAIKLRPHVITLDVSMPVLSGLNALPHLRAALPTAVIVVLTTNSSELYREEAYHRGADAYVLKHDALEELLPAIQAGLTPSGRQRVRSA